MSTTVNSQRDFVSKYVQLLGLSSPLTPDDFYSVSDYAKIQSLGPSLPKVTTPLPSLEEDEAAQLATLNVSFKSIKPPFKFSTQFTSYSASHSIYKAKLDLIDSLPVLKEAHVAPKHIKLLLKGKVLQNLTLLSALNLELDISFTCMIATPDPSEVDQPVTESATEESISSGLAGEAKSSSVVLPAAWAKILEVLQSELSENDAYSVLNKFKSSIV